MILQRYALERDDRLFDDPPGAHIVKYGARREAPVIEPWRCDGCAGMWTDRGSYAAGRCTRCGTERPIVHYTT